MCFYKLYKNTKIYYMNIEIGTQIIFSSKTLSNNNIHATCMYMNNEYYEFISDYGVFELYKNELEESIENFKIETIDETHELWENINNNILEMYQKQKDIETELLFNYNDEIDYYSILEDLGKEFDK